MSTEKGPAAVGAARPGGSQDGAEATTQQPGGEGGQFPLFGPAPPIVPRPVDAELNPPHNAAPTSREAAGRIKGRSPRQRQAVYRCILDAGSDGLTDEEIGIALGILMHSVSPRRGELVKLGVVRNSGRTRPTSSGRAAIVWRATAAGAAEGGGRG